MPPPEQENRERDRETIRFASAKARDGGRSFRHMPASFYWFLGFAFAGSILLIAPQTYSFGGLFKFFAAILMVSLYFLFGRMFHWYRPGNGGQRYIDNVYFLGFLYTQVGLVAGFMELWLSSSVDPNGVRRITSDQLIPIVAAALGASALGLLFKTWLDEIYEQRVVADGATDEDKWREHLADSARSLTAQVNEVVGEFTRMKDGVVDAASKIAAAVDGTTATAETVASNGQQVANSVRALGPALDTFRTTLVGAGEKAAQGVLDVHGDLAAATGALRELAAAARGMEAVVARMDEAAHTGRAAMETIGTAAQASHTAANTYSEEARNRIRELATRLEELTRSASADARDGFKTSIQRIEEDLNRTRDELGRHVERFALAVKDFNSRVDDRG